jgi:hypothetical protein
MRLDVDPGSLRLPPARSSGADPFKLDRQIRQYGDGLDGMPPVLVTRGLRGELMINDGASPERRGSSSFGQVLQSWPK